MRENCWRENFEETCQDIMEDAFLLDALATYMTVGGEFTRGDRAEYFPETFRRLCGYLSQHALELHWLEKQLNKGE